jgi:hypothetical protein
MPSASAVRKPAKTTKAATPAVVAPGDLIDRLFELREQKRAIDSEIKEIEALMGTCTEQIFANLDSLKMTRGDGKLATVSINESVVPNVEDWDLFLDYIYKKKAGHLLQRRASTEACRETFERKGAIPGVSAFVKRTLSLRTK